MNKVFIAKPTQGLCTAYLQELIDLCAKEGGGQVRLTPGVYTSATLYLKSHVELYLDAGAVLQGSDNFEDYSNACPHPRILPEIPHWYDSLIAAVYQEDIRISGEGIIDGVDCQNVGGEQGFRGPHTIYFSDCTAIALQGFTIVRSACYSMMFDRCQNIRVSDVNVREGQDGFRFGNCRGILIERCDVRSGDDCIGGGGNYDATIVDTWLNTPGGSTVLFSCKNLLMKRCRIWGSGYYPAVFRDDKRYSIGFTAIVSGFEYGYSWTDPSDHWVIEDTVFENVRQILRVVKEMNNQRTIPIKNLRFERVKAINVLEPMEFGCVDAGEGNLEIIDSFFSFAKEDPECEGILLKACDFDTVTLKNVRLRNAAAQPVRCEGGKRLVVESLVMETDATEQDVIAPTTQEVHLTPEKIPTTFTRYVAPNTTSLYVDKAQDETFRGPVKYIRGLLGETK